MDPRLQSCQNCVRRSCRLKTPLRPSAEALCQTQACGIDYSGSTTMVHRMVKANHYGPAGLGAAVTLLTVS